MSFLFYLITVCNTLGLIYLTYILYKKNSSKTLNKDKQVNLGSAQKINLTRFNPFDEMGGDQSFILCILDNSNSGVIITSLHCKDLTRVYAKSVKNGEGVDANLSKEEKTAIIKTIKSYN